MTRFIPGDRVWSRSAPRGCSHLLHRFGVVLRAESGSYGHEVLAVRFDPLKGSDHGEEVRDWFASFFVPASQAPKPDTGVAKVVEQARTSRAPRLTVKMPTDTRTEAQKEDAAKALLRSWGYDVLQVGRLHRQAVCTKCLAENNRDWKKARMFCPVHKTPVYALDTGSDPGVSDWQVRHCGRWPRFGVLLIENKRDEKSNRRKEQIALEARGWYPIVDIGNIDALCCLLLEFEESVLRVEPHPEVLAYLRRKKEKGE